MTISVDRVPIPDCPKNPQKIELLCLVCRDYTKCVGSNPTARRNQKVLEDALVAKRAALYRSCLRPTKCSAANDTTRPCLIESQPILKQDHIDTFPKHA